MNSKIILLIILFSCNKLNAQNFDYTIHPFYKMYENKSLPDTERIIALINLSGTYQLYQNIDTPIKLSYIALDFSKKIGYIRGIASVYRQLGSMYLQKGDHVKALETTLSALTYLDPLRKKYVSNKIQAFYVSLLGQLTAIYNRSGIGIKADSVGKLSIKLADELRDPELQAVCHGNYGTYLMDNAINYQAALNEFKIAASMQTKRGYISLADQAFYNQSILYNRLNQFDSALLILKKLEKSSTYKTDQVMRIDIKSSLADIYYHMEDLEAAEKTYLDLQSDLKKTGNLNRSKEVLEKLYAINEAKKNYELAYKYYKNFIQLRDSIDNVDKRVEMTKLELAFEAKKKAAIDKEILDKLKLEALLKEEAGKIALNEERTKFLSFELESAKKDAANQKLILTTKQKQAEIIQAAERNKLNLHAEITNANTKRKYTIIIFLVLLILTSTIFYFLRKKQALENIANEQELKTTVIENQMNVLKLQMNPHFIFNSLNSISGFINSQKNETANLYLSKFARLMRLILEQSEGKYISLREELSSLQLYIDLELYRLSDKQINYEVVIAENVDLDKILVLPLLLQPLIENCIWHGLAPKEGIGNIWLTVSADSKRLNLTIEDNGIGNRSNLTQKTHKSMAMRIIQDRIKLWEISSKEKTNFSFELNENGANVELNLPLILA